VTLDGSNWNRAPLSGPLVIESVAIRSFQRLPGTADARDPPAIALSASRSDGGGDAPSDAVSAALMGFMESLGGAAGGQSVSRMSFQVTL